MDGWNIENALNRYAPHLLHSPNLRPEKPVKPNNTEITQERLQLSYQIAASAVKEYGDIYLEIFERLHHEIEKSEMKRSLLNTAFQVAKREI